MDPSLQVGAVDWAAQCPIHVVYQHSDFYLLLGVRRPRSYYPASTMADYKTEGPSRDLALSLVGHVVSPAGQNTAGERGSPDRPCLHR